MAIQLKKILALIFFALPAFVPFFAHAAVISLPGNSLGLIVHYTMDGSTVSGSTVFDTGSSGDNATLTGSPLSVIGKTGEALSFNGSGQYLQSSQNLSSDIAGSFTISMWVNIAALPASETQLFEVASGPEVGMSIKPGNVWQFYTGAGSNNALTATYTQSTGQWMLLTTVYDDSTDTKYIYINGVEQASASTGGHIGFGTTPFYLATDSGSRDLDGSLDDLRIYDRALSASEIAALYQPNSATIEAASLSPSNGLSGTLTASWSFDASTVSGTTVADQSGNGHDLTLENGASVSPGYSGDALTLNGTDQYAAGEVGTLPTSVSLSMWVKVNDVSTEQSILVEQDSEVANTGYHFTLVGIKNGEFYAGFWNIGDIASTAITAGTWYHVILTYDGVADTQSLYVNNVLQGTQNGTWDPPDTIYFLPGLQQEGCSFTSASGYCGDLANYFNGQIDSLQAYDQAFTQSDVNELGSGPVTTINASSAGLTDGSSLSSGLVGLWTFDGADLSTTTADDTSGEGNNGTLSGSPEPTIGKLGQALAFNGTTSTVCMGTPSSLDLTGPMSISAWIDPTGWGGGSRGRIYDKDGSSKGMMFLLDDLNTTDGLGFGINAAGTVGGASTNYVYTQSNTITLDQWQLVTVTYDGAGNVEFYVNGVQYPADRVLGVVPADSTGVTACIGSSNATANRFFPGKIDDVRVYDRALSAGEVEQLYDIGG